MGRENTGLVCGAPRAFVGQRFSKEVKIRARNVGSLQSRIAHLGQSLEDVEWDSDVNDITEVTFC